MRGDTEPKLQYFLYDGLDTAIDLYIEELPEQLGREEAKITSKFQINLNK